MESLTSCFMAGTHDVPAHSTYCHRVLHPLNTKIFYVTTLTLKAESCWHSLYLSVSFKTKEKKTFSLFEVCCALFLTSEDGVRCNTSCSFRKFSMLFHWHRQFYMTSPLLQISCLQFTFSDYCLLSTSWLKAFAWPFNKLKGGWVGPKSASIHILFTLRN